MQVLHGYSDGNSKGKVVVPEPSFVIKTRDLTCLTDNNEQSLDISKYNNNNNTNNTTTNNNNGIKIFINIVYSDMIEPFHLKKMLPEQLNELKNNKNINHPDKNIKESEEDIAVRIPISIANLRDDRDNNEHPCLVVDVMFNTNTVTCATQHIDAKYELASIAIIAVCDKYKLKLDHRCSFPKGMKYKGYIYIIYILYIKLYILLYYYYYFFML
eukprot:GHVR01099477.1.p1 GENE.GHVR01099477.1~~GHVR01099477.1.p1  ORF type:complete len:214 (-),score=63.37 GHVR01099477.1:24-665(-)